MQHFLISDGFSEGELRLHDSDLLHQLIKVLRFRKGEQCVLLDGRGKKAQAEIMELHKKEAVFEVGEVEFCESPKREIHLLCALSKKPATFELIVQKAVEMGLTSITPLVTERCQVRELRKTDRLELIMKEAFEQSEGCFFPELRPVLNLKEFLADLPEGEIWVGDARKTGEILKASGTSTYLVIGPEGGLSETELDALSQAGAKNFRLGQNVLRMETAAIAALSILSYL